MFKQQSGRSMYPNEINLIKNGFEAIGNISKERASELHSDTHYGFIETITSDNLIVTYAKPKD